MTFQTGRTLGKLIAAATAKAADDYIDSSSPLWVLISWALDFCEGNPTPFVGLEEDYEDTLRHHLEAYIRRGAIPTSID